MEIKIITDYSFLVKLILIAVMYSNKIKIIKRGQIIVSEAYSNY